MSIVRSIVQPIVRPIVRGIVGSNGGASSTLLDGLISWYEFDNDLTDSKGSNDIADSGPGVAYAAADDGTVVVVDAADVLNIASGHGFPNGANDFTCMVRFKLVGGTTGALIGNETSAYDATSGDWSIWINSGTARFTCHGSTWGDTDWAGGSCSTGTWYTLVARYSGATDREQQISVNDSNTSATHSEAMNTNGNAFHIGRQEGISRDFDGQIQRIAVWNRVLTDEEVTEANLNKSYAELGGTTSSYLLLETGDNIILEDGSGNVLLEGD